MTTGELIAGVKSEIEQILSQMRAQVAAFRRTATPEISASYVRIVAAIGREDALTTQRLGKSGVKNLMDETELIAWEVPHLLEELFTETWIQDCFFANDSLSDTTAYHVFDYLRGRGRPESPFPAYFQDELHQVFYPLARLLKRVGFRVGPLPAERGRDGFNPASEFRRVIENYRMNPALVSGAVAFGEQARRCLQLRERLRQLETKRASEEAKILWDSAEAERKKRP